MTDSTLTPDSPEGATSDAAPAATDAGEATLPAPPSPRRTRKRTSPNGAATAGPFRVATANVQSFPVNALTLAQALEDLRRNAADGDLVLLQEIAARYRTLVQMAFPSSEWVVYYGRSDNSTPIAFRRELFSKVEGRVDLLHPARKHLHTRRYMTYLRLRSRALDLEFHVTNLHMVAGAFNGVDEPDQALRLEEWNEGIASTGGSSRTWWRPACPWSAAVTTTAGSTDTGPWAPRSPGSRSPTPSTAPPSTCSGSSTATRSPGASGRRSTSRADARRTRHATATTACGGPPPRSPAPPPAPRRKIPTTSTKPKRPEPPRQPVREPSRPTSPPSKEDTMPGAFELTTYGDGRPKRVDWKTRAALRGGRAPPRLPAHDRAGLLQQRRGLGLGRHARRRGRGRPALVGLAAQGPRAADRRLRGVVPAAGPRSLGPAHPRRADRPRQARAGGRPPGDRLPRRPRRTEEQPARPVLAAQPHPRLPLPAEEPGPDARPQRRRGGRPRRPGAPSRRTGRWTGSTPATSRAARSTSRPPRPPGCAGGTSRPPRATRSRTRRTASA